MAYKVARWESKRGRYFVDLVKQDDNCYTYTTDNGGGNLGKIELYQAIEHCKMQASYCKSKMTRIL